MLRHRSIDVVLSAVMYNLYARHTTASNCSRAPTPRVSTSRYVRTYVVHANFSYRKHSYEKQVSVFSSLYVITKDDIECTMWMQYKIQWILIFLHIALYIVMSIKPFRKIVFEVFSGNGTI